MASPASKPLAADQEMQTLNGNHRQNALEQGAVDKAAVGTRQKLTDHSGSACASAEIGRGVAGGSAKAMA
jgi:hypothetical protein